MRRLIITLSVMAACSSSSASANIERQGSWYQEVGLDRGMPVRRGALHSANESPDTQLAPATSACQLSVLARLGWKVERSPDVNVVVFSGGNPCSHATLADVHAQGGLQLKVPATMNESALRAALNSVLAGQNSICAYKFRVQAAASTAAWKLNENLGFTFYTGGFPYIRFTRGQFWNGSCGTSSGRAGCFYPAVQNDVAIGEFQKGKIATECALGLQGAEYNTLLELYGNDNFNRVFRPEELVFGAWNIISNTASATWGRLDSSNTVVDRKAIVTSRQGAMAFAGVSGYIGNVYGDGSLDNPIDRGENFETLSVSLLAGAELAKRGGFPDFNVMNERLYQLGRWLTPELEKLTLTNRDPSRIPMSTQERAAFREMQSILSNPVYREFKVWVHPLGIMSLGQHIVRLLERNPRTPYTFELYPSRTNKGLYVRYVNTLLATCGQ